MKKISLISSSLVLLALHKGGVNAATRGTFLDANSNATAGLTNITVYDQG